MSTLHLTVGWSAVNVTPPELWAGRGGGNTNKAAGSGGTEPARDGSRNVQQEQHTPPRQPLQGDGDPMYRIYSELVDMNGLLVLIMDALEVLAGRARVRSHQDYWTAQDWLAQAEATPPGRYHDPHEREKEIADNKRSIAFMEKEFPWLKDS